MVDEGRVERRRHPAEAFPVLVGPVLGQSCELLPPLALDASHNPSTGSSQDDDRRAAVVAIRTSTNEPSGLHDSDLTGDGRSVEMELLRKSVDVHRTELIECPQGQVAGSVDAAVEVTPAAKGLKVTNEP